MMKKLLSFLTAICLLLPVMTAARAQQGFRSVFEAQKAEKTEVAGDLFDDAVRDFTCAPYGNRVDYAMIGGWVISRGYLPEAARYCLIGQKPNGARVALTDTLPSGFVPASDAFIYYGEDENGDMRWLIRRPDAEKPERLNLLSDDEVFYADEAYIWCYTSIGANTTISRLPRKGGEKEEVAGTRGFVIAMLESGGVLVMDYQSNELKSVTVGGTTTLYAPEDDLILNVFSAGKNIWVQLEKEYGLLEDGALQFRLPGTISTMVGTTDQYVLLAYFLGSGEDDVILFNDVYNAYARIGYAPSSGSELVELQPGPQLTLWGRERSLLFTVPPADEWIPYGYYDVESAREAMGKQIAAPPAEPDFEDVVTITIPAALCALTDEATATAQAEAAGIKMTINRDGSFTYFFTPEQQREQLSARAKELRDTLETGLYSEPYSECIKAYTANDDFSAITFTVDKDRLQDSGAKFLITVIGLVAPTYQALQGNDESPTTLITLVDYATLQNIATYVGPDDFSE